MVSKHTADDLDSLDSERIRVDLANRVLLVLWGVETLQPKIALRLVRRYVDLRGRPTRRSSKFQDRWRC